LLTLKTFVIGLCAVVLTAGCGQAVRNSGGATASQQLQVSATGSDVAVTGGTPGEDELLQKIVDGMNPSDIVAVGIVGPPVEAPNVPASSVWLEVTHPATALATRAELARGRWEGLVVASAYLEQCNAAGVPCIQGVELVGPAGTVDGDFASVIKIDPSTPGAPSSSDASVAAALTAAARADGLTSVSVTFEDAAGFSVPVMTGVADDPKAFLANYHSTTILGDQPPFASLVEVKDSMGSVVYAEGLAPAINEGTAWVKPGLQANTLGFNSGQG
jgi:hypothetical protein